MNLKRSLVALGMAAGVALGAAAVAPAASAAPAGCASGGLCVYWNTGWTGSVQTVYQDNYDLTGYANFNNALHGSAWNNGNSCNVVLWKATGYQGTGWRLDRGTGFYDIGDNLSTIGSNKWCTY
ncbi:peptidase inhibitor family I36 protein [Streptomyces litmocidini]|uniref:Peptidase inhibitor family I36 protein n=1 Tax=Streptomyces litmocidini TaxID=67318 RepID=A0ABW7UE00_9ACTN|nr:peptidase inhibitor family I36 protein [Streptomyces sp. PanSC19]ROQ24670.1 peptidase inhibitor family I36 [Streptomyces sp. PanSC19]